jgi:LPS export ABC transporter protein LptC
MNKRLRYPVIRLPFYFLVTAIVLFSACERKLEKINNAEVLSLPSHTAKDFVSVYSDSGKIQLILSAAIMETYNNKEEPYSEFRQGIKANYYNGKEKEVASVVSKYAKYHETKKLWELKDSVVVVFETSDRLETEQLFWDQEKDRIFTDRFVKLTNEDQTVLGNGFESDSKLTRRWIKNVTATIYVKDE